MKVITTREGEVLKVETVKGNCSDIVAGMYNLLEEAEIDQALTLKLENNTTVVKLSYSIGEVTATFTRGATLYLLKRSELVGKLQSKLKRALDERGIEKE